MAIGQRIKFFRNLRNLTQKELGQKLGFPERAADVRIAQYESEKRIPKDDLIKALSYCLGVSPVALRVPDIDTDIGFMHTLFALEDTRGFRINKIEGEICITLNKHHKSYIAMLERLTAWQEEYQKLSDGEITQEQYNDWRYTYPKMVAAQFISEIDELRARKKKSE